MADNLYALVSYNEARILASMVFLSKYCNGLKWIALKLHSLRFKVWDTLEDFEGR